MHLPPIAPPLIEIQLGKHKLGFREPTWVESLALQTQQVESGDSRVPYMSTVLTQIDGLLVTYDLAHRFFSNLPKGFMDRLVVLYGGQLNPIRVFTAELPYQAPKALAYQKQVEDEDAEREEDGDAFLRDKFGAEAMAEEQAVAARIAQAARRPDGTYAGATRAMVEPEEDDTPHMVIG